MQQQVRDINQFLNCFLISNHDQETKILQSSSHTYLVKNIQLDPQVTDLATIMDTLEQHQSLSSQYILTLLTYQAINNNKASIRAIYNYGTLTLEQEIKKRQQNQFHFTSNEIWTIVYSVTRALEYLSTLNIGYGVLSCNKIFINNKIKILDPSAVAQDPLVIGEGRLYSPQIIEGRDDIDILKSDVFVFGLCILEAALLLDFTNSAKYSFDETHIKIYLTKLESLYQNQLFKLVKQMLQYQPDNRPSFLQIRQYLQKTLQIKDQNVDDYFSPLNADLQDEASNQIVMEDTDEFENIDIEEEEEESETQSMSLSEFQKAKIKYLNDSRRSIRQTSKLQQNSEITASKVIHNNSLNIVKRQVAKSIKQKLVKKMTDKDLEVVEVRKVKKNSNYSKSKSKNEKENQSQFINPKIRGEKLNLFEAITTKSNYTKRNGMGRVEYLDGGYYEGQWHDDCMEGYGKLYYPNNTIAYEGYWAQNQFNGTGKVYNEQPDLTSDAVDYRDFGKIGQKWLFYEGQFSHDSRHGRGMMKFANGDKFIGNFSKDIAEGEGSFYCRNGDIVKGVWSKNIFIGSF